MDALIKLSQEFVDYCQRVPNLISSNNSSEQQQSSLLQDYLISFSELPTEAKTTMCSRLADNGRIDASMVEEARVLVDLSLRIKNSPSVEVRFQGNALLKLLLDSNNPSESFNEIEELFLSGTVPRVGVLFILFAKFAYPEKKLTHLIDSSLKGDTLISPVLTQVDKPWRRYDLILRDLIKNSVKSGSPNLLEYLRSFQEFSSISDRVETGASLTKEEQEKFVVFLRRVKHLFNESLLSLISDKKITDISSKDLSDLLKTIKEYLQVKNGQSIVDRLTEMYLVPAGYSSIQAVLEDWDSTRQGATVRNLETASRILAGEIVIKEGDFLKGIISGPITLDETRRFNIERILQNIFFQGSVSKEFTGSNESDYTPLDTDVGRVSNGGVKSFEEIVRANMANAYGDILFLIKNRGQFQVTGKTGRHEADDQKYEVFQTTSADDHYGIRTGFPLSEVDVVVVKDNIVSDVDNHSLAKLFNFIARLGIYVPVVDQKGTLIFSPKLYQLYRQAYSGVDYYHGGELEVITDVSSPAINQELVQLASKVSQRNETELKKQRLIIRSIVADVLDTMNIRLGETEFSDFVNARLIETGSTARNTYLEESYDLDFVLELNPQDYVRAADIFEDILEKLEFSKQIPAPSGDTFLQLRLERVKIGDQFLDFDLGIVMKMPDKTVTPEQANADRLRKIGLADPNKLHFVLAGIVFLKEKLLSVDAYKKIDGGIGGMGVETLVLSFNGNVELALIAMIDASFDEEGRRVTFEQFKLAFPIFQPGTSHRPVTLHQNYVTNLTETAWLKMLTLAQGLVGGRQSQD